MKENKYSSYKECPILCQMERSTKPLISKVKVDKMTKICEEYFDYSFDGKSKVYPFEIPKELKKIKNFQIIIITGASGSGKSTLLKQFIASEYEPKQYDNSKAIISNFKDQTDAMDRLSSVGLGSVPTWARPYNVLSTGEKFRADLALNIDSDTVFDEYTSVVNRETAISCSISLSKYIRKHKLKGVVFCSCHNDFINYMNPDFVIDLDEQKVFDCRNCKISPIEHNSKGIYLDESLEKIGEIYL